MKTLLFLIFSVAAFAQTPVSAPAPTGGSHRLKPAQTDLTAIFLQIGENLQREKSPLPYLRHVAAEQKRVEALYRTKNGRPGPSYLPVFMTEAYLDQLAKNWEGLSPLLKLDVYANDSGSMLCDAIKGTRGTGTILIDIFNAHQTKVFDSMVGKGPAADFEVLRLEIVRELELDKAVVNEASYEIGRRDAISFALGIHGSTIKLFRKLDQGLKHEDSEKVKSVLTSTILEIGMMAQAELKIGLLEWSLSKPSTSAR